jgi:hypothetical protein
MRQLLQPPKTGKKERPGLLQYLEERLGRSSGNGAEREFHCHKCIEILGDESSKKKLSINLRKGVAYCFRCAYRAHNLDRLFRDMNNGVLKIVEAQIIAGESKLPAVTLKDHVEHWLSDADKASVLKPQKLPAEMVPIGSEEGYPGYHYMTTVRGIHPDLLEKYQLGYAARGEYANRVIFPVVQNGCEIYFTTRYCGDHVVKAKNPLNQDGFVKKTDVIWNYDNLRGVPIIAVAEGPISAMAFSDAGAILGKEISDAQVNLLSDLVQFGLEEVIVALDSDAGKYSERIHRKLSTRVPLCTVLYFDWGDPDERRAELPALLETRQQPDLRSQVLSRFRDRSRARMR